jgi:predicted flavoprotein YhiN
MDLKIETKALSDSMLASFSPVKKNGSGGEDFGALLKHAETKQSEAAQELEKYLKMTPAQRMAPAIMKQLGISQEQFDAMSPEQQAAVTARIAEIMRQQMEEKMAGNQASQGSTAL